MKMKFSIFVLLFASLTIFSCSKDDDNPNPDENQPGTLFTKMTQGLIPGDDTVFVFNYDEEKRITSVINITDKDTLEAVYDAAGLVTDVIGKGTYAGGSKVTFKYNENKQLIQSDFATGQYKSRYTFEYTGGVISKKNQFSALSENSAFELFRYTTYEVTSGNITRTREYTADDVFMGEATYTYNDEPNVFQPMCFFNWLNFLGADDIANMETFFNKNLMTGGTSTATGSTPVSATLTYTYNDKKQLTKVVLNSASYVSTRQFEY